MTENERALATAEEAALEARLSRNLGITSVQGGDAATASTRLDYVPRSPAEWNRKGRQAMWFTRLMAVGFFAMIVVGWPLGSAAGWWQAKGTLDGWSYWQAISIELVLIGIIVPFLIFVIGYVLAALMQTHGAAQHIATAAQQFLTPDETAAANAASVGAAVRREMDQLNVGLDGALSRLAAVEAMIRRHVEAIETAGVRIEQRSTGAMAVVASERARLIDLTEQLNQQADGFAAAIADTAKASIEAMHSADDLLVRAQGQLEDRLVKLDSVASQALRSFQALAQAIVAADASMKQSVGAIEATAADTRKAVETAQKAADAAAESAARNAANVGAAAQFASHEATKSARASIEASQREADRAARAAAEAAARDAQRIVEASTGAIGEVRRATDDP
ncbi:MAG: hypothetical protein K2Q06_06425, partial [Parvularculaceae bacterium]|nr:hypothetical protein [Parvularculaceae bacterium]